MTNDYKEAEWKRMFYIILATVSGGLLSGYWLASLCLALFSYVLWMLYKLHQMYQWLKAKDPSMTPDSDGLWEGITSQIYYLQKHCDKRKQRMNESLQRFEGIIKGLPYATIVLNDKNEIDWANEQSSVLLGVNIKIDRGQRIENLIRLPKVHKTLQKNSDKEIEIVSPLDQNRKLSLQLISIQADLKLLIARDISEAVRIRQMRRNFIANASHELRTPLTVIAGYLEIIQTDETLADQFKIPVIKASEQALRMQRIIEDLLTLSRLENSGLKDEANRVLDMPSILTSICHNEIELLAKQFKHRLSMDLCPNLSLRGSESEIVSVCSNLIHNAIQHTTKGTAIKVSWKKALNGEACLAVQDQGAGIPNEHLSQLTERFYRVDKGRSKNTGGTGLGLAIVQHIIQRHNGRLEIDSTIGKGSIFTVCFPRERVV